MAKIKSAGTLTKKDSIVKAAAALFRTRGYKATSMRELALSMGVEAPSLYNHIGSKSELLQCICFKVANAFQGHLQQVENLQASPVVKLEKLIRFQIQMMLQAFDEVYVSNHEWRYLEEPHHSDYLQQRKTYEQRMVMLITEGKGQNLLKDVHPQVAVLTILSAVRGLELWQRYKKELDAAVLENNMVNQLLTGIIN
ncbi:MAG: TetR/AcrR family transcriptional regulator [Chitinophagaceae bacterium]|nr:MAG: TetR/AcrR family transcriptional regulator [Chitinophagaceae bacterium]